jgi:hypothetical protein
MSVKLREAKSPVFRAKSATALNAASDGTLNDLRLKILISVSVN